MSYLKTILTYHLPSEAEVDKSLLESHGLTVNLLNANTSRNELGAPFFIQLQVPGEETERAVAILKQFNPQRFGSVENVRKIEAELGVTLLKLMVSIVVAGIAVHYLTENKQIGDRLATTLMGGLIFGVIGYLIYELIRRPKGGG